MSDFKSYLRVNKIEVSDSDLAANADWVKESIKSKLFTSAFGEQKGAEVNAQWDPQIQKALSYLPQAQALEEHVKPAGKTTTTTASR